MIDLVRASKYCKDDITKIENYDKAISDTTQTWQCHHRLELTLDGEFAHTASELDRMGMYFNRPYFELIFLTQQEHLAIHPSHMKGKHLSDDVKQYLSTINKGKPGPNKGRKFSEESKAKMRMAALNRKKQPWTGKHRSAETKRKISEALRHKS